MPDIDVLARVQHLRCGAVRETNRRRTRALQDDEARAGLPAAGSDAMDNDLGAGRSDHCHLRIGGGLGAHKVNPLPSAEDQAWASGAIARYHFELADLRQGLEVLPRIAIDHVL